MLYLLTFCGSAVLFLAGCGEQPEAQLRPISAAVPIGVYKAQAPQGLERQIAGPGWQAVTFEGRHYLVAESPVFTEHHIVSARRVENKVGALEVVLDEAGKKAWSEYTAAHANLNQPVGIKVGGRWTAFPLILAQVSNGRATLLGLTQEEIGAILGTGR